MTRRLVYEPIGSLVPATRNPKKHDLDALGASVGRFGYVEPVVVDDRTGRLVAGHGRVEQLQRLQATGAEPPPGISVGDDGAWNVPVVRGWESRNDAEADAYLVASNRTTELGGWDDSGLAGLLTEIAQQAGLDGTGYDDDELTDLLALVAGPTDLDDLEDKYGDPTPEAVWPVLRFKVPPVVRHRYLALVEGQAGDDADLFTYLLDLAESTSVSEDPG